MPRRSFTAEQIIAKLRQIEVLMGQGNTAVVACKEAEISEQTYYRWRKEYGGLRLLRANVGQLVTKVERMKWIKLLWKL